MNAEGVRQLGLCSSEMVEIFPPKGDSFLFPFSGVTDGQREKGNIMRLEIFRKEG